MEWSKEAQKTHRMIHAASRKIRDGVTCDCGASVKSHKFIASTLGMQTTSVYRCQDGQLSTLIC